MNERNNGKGIFYGVIGVATLVVAIIGATFAYFTATETAGENEITGNAATISFGLAVDKKTTVDETKGGMIPMTDAMIEAAVANTAGACLDDNGNAVCQIYEITVTNNGTASMFLDGFVNLTGGLATSGTQIGADAATNMRWVQVFHTGSEFDTGYTVAGNHAIAGATGVNISFEDTAKSTTKTDLSTVRDLNEGAEGYSFNNTNYAYIANNYLRTSTTGKSSGFARTDEASSLIFNQYIAPKDDENNYDEVKLYFAVWLTETGTDQTPLTSGTVDVALNFFGGRVIFNSAQGGEVSATFTGYARVQADTLTA